ncbi:oxidoreductase family protein [Apiospora marii]|uniref:oxidoreductase family protein n=1 Tax=Apiospora marii TaxID=335849 RepID=UPI0031310115
MAATHIPQNLTAPSPLHINDTCPSKTMMPDAETIPGLPLNITTYLTPADDAIYWAMDACCSPNPVGLADGCYFWCEQPPTYPEPGPWWQCVSSISNLTRPSIQGMHKAAAGRLQCGGPTTTAVVLLAVLAGSVATWL